MQKLIVALALSGAAAFVSPSAQRASLRVNAEEETAALREWGKVGDSARRGVVARARDVEMLTEGKAAEVLKRQQGRKHSANHRKKKKAKGSKT